MNAIRRLIANVSLGTRKAVLLRIVFALVFPVMLPATSARAEMTQDDAIDFAINAAVSKAGSLVGISIPPEAVQVLRDMVSCGVKGGNVGDCAKQAAINVALKETPA